MAAPKRPTEAGNEPVAKRLACAAPLVSGYYFTLGLRRVPPYWSELVSWVKGRWRGRTLLDVFVTEFRAYTPEYFRDAIADGRIQVAGQIVPPDHVLQHGQQIVHKVHRHEPPVAAAPVRIVGETEGFVAVDKPASVPTHPTGKYHWNSLTKILERDLGRSDLFAVHRLDRLTSGLVVFAKSSKLSAATSLAIQAGHIRKTYLARVKGRFPDGRITVDKAILTESRIFGVSSINEKEGRSATTHFERISFNGHTSVVRCQPETGRTHQIRVHLEHLGHPIANDPLYGSQRSKEMRGKNFERQECDRVLQASTLQLDEDPGHSDVDQHLVDNYVASCADCNGFWRDPERRELVMWLHALEYECDNKAGIKWSFKTEHPDWARAEYATSDNDLV